MSNNTRQHDTARVPHETTQHNTSTTGHNTRQHEYNTSTMRQTRVQQDPTEVQRKK